MVSLPIYSHSPWFQLKSKCAGFAQEELNKNGTKRIRDASSSLVKLSLNSRPPQNLENIKHPKTAQFRHNNIYAVVLKCTAAEATWQERRRSGVHCETYGVVSQCDQLQFTKFAESHASASTQRSIPSEQNRAAARAARLGGIERFFLWNVSTKYEQQKAARIKSELQIDCVCNGMTSSAGRRSRFLS